MMKVDHLTQIEEVFVMVKLDHTQDQLFELLRRN